MKDVQMKLHLPEQIRKTLRGVAEVFDRAGFECYLVGGSVRDFILGHPVLDYDFATNARPEEVMRLFRRVVPTGIKHGTVSVMIGEHAFEVTTYRADGKYLDGRHPENVRFSKTLKEDVARRDFTINGLAYDVMKDEVVDLAGGLEDIEKRIIRTIGDPYERFTEDGLRTYRACRFAARLGFAIEEETFSAIGRSLAVAARVSMERVRDEIMKLLEAETPSVGFEHMRKSGLLDIVLPELSSCHGALQNKYHMYDIYYHSLYSCDAAPREKPLIRLASLLHDLGKLPTRREGEDGDYTFYNHEVIGARICRRVMKRLKFSNEDTARVLNMVSNHMFHYTEEWTDGAVRRFMRKVGVENLDDLVVLRIADRVGNGMRGGLPQPIRTLMKRIEKVIEDENAITVRDLDIDGHVIMEEFKVQPGPIIGAILNELLELVLDNPEMNTRAALVEKASEIYGRIKDEDRFKRR
jgi:tRNA nucleotidyltransferase (CCA-adding enzyme)